MSKKINVQQISGLLDSLTSLETNKQSITDLTLETADKTIPGAINEIFNNIAGTVGIISITYAALLSKINTSELIPGVKYLITDYKTTYIQPVSGVSLESDAIEPIIVEAILVNELAPVAKSTIYTDDIIYYDPVSTDEGSTYGRITRRIDTAKNINVGTDWRNIKYRRWAIDIDAIPSWNHNIEYIIGDIVEYDGGGTAAVAICLTPNIDIDPNDDTTGSWFQIYESNFSGPTNKYCSYTPINMGVYINDVLYQVPVSSDYIDSYLFFDVNNTLNVYIAGDTMYNSVIANACSNITIESGFLNNTINRYFSNNDIEDTFSYNVIYDNFNNNKIGSNFTNNYINIRFQYNNIGYNFSYNGIGINFQYNNVGSNIINCVLNDRFTNSEFGNNIQHLITGSDYTNYRINSGISFADYYLPLIANYTKYVYATIGINVALSYMNEFGDQIILDVTYAIPVINEAIVNNIGVTAVDGEFTYTYKGVPTEVGISWSDDSGSTWTDSPQTIGSPVSWVVTGLTPNTTYYYKAYVKVGIDRYELAIDNYDTYAIPSMSDEGASNITATTATIGGSINYAGSRVTEVGVGYCLTEDGVYTDVPKIPIPDLNGDAFSVDITGLTPNTQYFFRPYIIIDGIRYQSVGYGDFTTESIMPPVINQPSLSFLGATSIIGQFTYTYLGTPTEVGIAISLSEYGVYTYIPCSIGSPCSFNVTDLEPNTIYYYKGYIIAGEVTYTGLVNNSMTLSLP